MNCFYKRLLVLILLENIQLYLKPNLIKKQRASVLISQFFSESIILHHRLQGYIIFHMQDRITIIQPCLYLQSMYQFTNLSETYNNLLPSMVLLSAPLWNSKNPPVQGIYMKSMSPKDHSILPLFHNPYKGYLLPPPHLFH